MKGRGRRCGMRWMKSRCSRRWMRMPCRRCRMRKRTRHGRAREIALTPARTWDLTGCRASWRYTKPNKAESWEACCAGQLAGRKAGTRAALDFRARSTRGRTMRAVTRCPTCSALKNRICCHGCTGRRTRGIISGLFTMGATTEIQTATPIITGATCGPARRG